MTDADMELIARGMVPVVKDAIARATEPLLARIAALEARQAVPGRDGRDGLPGIKGDSGADGKDGRDGVDGKDAPPVTDADLDAAVQRYLAAHPVKDGKDGRDGVDGKDGKDGDQGLVGDRGPIGPPGEKGIDGKDGKDGATFTAKNILGHEWDGERTLVLRFGVDDVVSYSAPITFHQFPIYRGVYQDGKAYEAGDVVTWAGAMWFAKASTTAKPGLATEDSRAWQLCVKAGRDGKQGPEGKSGPQGPQGPKGDRGPDRW